MSPASIITAELKNVSAELNIDIILCESGYKGARFLAQNELKYSECCFFVLFFLPTSVW